MSEAISVSPADEALQLSWRTDPLPFDTATAYAAVIAALKMGGIKAWIGDGTGMVVQMLENAYNQRDALLAERDNLRDLLSCCSNECEHLSHRKGEFHNADEACPVSMRIGHALTPEDKA